MLALPRLNRTFRLRLAHRNAVLSAVLRQSIYVYSFGTKNLNLARVYYLLGLNANVASFPKGVFQLSRIPR